MDSILKSQIISKRLYVRKIYLTLLLVAIILLSGLIVTSKNFNQSSKALAACANATRTVTIPANGSGTLVTTVNVGDTNYDGCNVTVPYAGRMVIYGTHNFASITIRNGGALYPGQLGAYNPPATNSLKMVLNVDGALNIENGGYIIGTNRGYAPGQGPAPSGSVVIPGTCTRPTNFWDIIGWLRYLTCVSNLTKTWGAGHAGHGYTNDAAYAPVYDTTNAEPLEAGSGGMGTWYGGGYIKIVARTIKLEAGSVVEANGMGGRSGSATYGGSGGSIILRDEDPESYYRGFIAATGGGCYAAGNSFPGGGTCAAAPGGGGRIFIATASSLNQFNINPTTKISARESTIVVPLGNCCYNDWEWVTGPPLARWTSWGYPANALTVSGSNNEYNNVSEKGLITIISSARPQIKKTLSSYNINPGDTVVVTLDFTALKDEQMVEDEILHDDNGNEFTVVNFPVPAGTNARIVPRTGAAGSHTKLVIDMPMHVPTTPNPLLPASNDNKRIYQYTLKAPSQ